MTPREIKRWAEELRRFHKRLGPLFRDKRQREWCQKWIHGLLLDGVRKNAAELARAVPGGEVQAMQQFLTDSSWDWNLVIGGLQAMVEETIGCDDGILVVDDTGFRKKGTESVGVARQYSGTLGKVENCQIGVFLAYVGSTSQALVDARLYLPKEWADDEARRKKADVPKDVRFRTKAKLAVEMIRNATQGPLSARWVTCDDGYGRDGGFREALAALGLSYVCEVPSNTKVWTHLPVLPEQAPHAKGRPRTRAYVLPDAPRPQTARGVAQGTSTWRRIEVRRGTRRPIAADWAAVRVWPSYNREPGAQEQWLLIERAGDKQKYYLSNAPADTLLETLAYVAKQEWFVEQSFRDAKQEVGLAHYEVRKWQAWYRHVTLCMLAALFLTSLQEQWKKRAPL